MKRSLLFLLLLLPVLALLGVGCKKADDGKVVATVNGEKISQQEFNAELDKIPMKMKMMVASQQGKRSFLDRLVEKRLVLQAAKKENIEKRKEFQDQLAELKEQLLLETLLKSKMEAASKPSDEEMKKYYDANKEQFKKGQEIRTRLIAVKTATEAQEIQAKVAKGEDFGELARKYSIDPNAKQTGGDMGFHPRGTLIPEIEESVAKLDKAGQVTPPIQTKIGYVLVKLEGTKPPSYAAFEEVKDFIKQKTQEDALKSYLDGLKKPAKIVINEAAFKESLKTAEPNAGKTENGPVSIDAAKTIPAQNAPEKAAAPQVEKGPKK